MALYSAGDRDDVIIAEFKQINVVEPEKLWFQTINYGEKYIVLSANVICWATCFHSYSPKVAKG